SDHPGRRKKPLSTPMNSSNIDNTANAPRITTPDEYRRMTRRQLLALAPALSLGLLAVPAIRERVLSGGLALADRASESIYSAGQLSPTFGAAALTPLAQ